MTQENQITEMKKNFYELNTLFELGLLANQSLDLSAFMDNLSQFLKVALNISDVHFFLEDGKDFTIANNRIFIELINNREEIWKFINEQKLLPLKNEQNEPIFNDFYEENSLSKINAKYFRGFSHNKKLFAICSLGEKIGKDELTAEEIFLLNRIFGYVEPMLHKFVIRENQRDDLNNLYKMLNNVSILYNISQTVNFIDDLKRLLSVILDKALEALDAEKGSLMLYNASDNSLQVKVVYGLEDKRLEEKINSGIMNCNKIRVGEGIAGIVFSKKQSIISNLGESDPRFLDMENAPNANINSLICVPLITKNEAIGVINISNKRDGKLFNKLDLEFLEALANQAAIAIDNAKLYELATKDGLTQLYTYRHFYTLLENELSRAVRYNRNLSVLMMDIDNFKQINDLYGHPVGDRMLRDVASVIENTVRKIDLPARYGGEEFAVILPETSGEEAVSIAQRLRINIEKLKLHVGEDKFVNATISIGISTFPACASNEEELIETADKALYAAKDCGKNCVYLYKQDGSQECKL